MVLRTVSVVAALAAAASALSFDVEEAKKSPVKKVIALLKDMKTELETDKAADKVAYDKLACWCLTNKNGKTKAISDAVTKMSDLHDTIIKEKSKSRTLQAEIYALKKELAKNKESLATATSMREKEKGQFLISEKEMTDSIRSLKSAIKMLSKHNGGKAAFLSDSAVGDAYSIARDLMDKHYDILAADITTSEQKVIASLVQKTSQAYAPASGEIFGILKQMQDTFETNLKQAQTDEKNAQDSFYKLREAKSGEINVGKTSLSQKSEQRAKADSLAAAATEARSDTKKAWISDKKFLSEVIVKCKESDIDWVKRSKIRNSEIEAVSKTIAILSSDEAKDSFSKTLAQKSASFLQTREENRRAQARAQAQAIVVLSKDPNLSALVVATRLNPFPKVKKAIDAMVGQIIEEQELEKTEKANCINNLQKNKKDSAEEEHTRMKLAEKVASMDQDLKEQTAGIAAYVKDIAELDKQLAEAYASRKAEADKYRAGVAEQEQAQKLLNSALGVLKKVYDGKPALVQAPPKLGRPAPRMRKFKKSGSSTSILAMIERIVTQSKNMVKEAKIDETLSIKAAMKLISVIGQSKDSKVDAKTNLESQKARTDTERTSTMGMLKNSEQELATLAATRGTLAEQCTWMLDNFLATQRARDSEVETLKNAKNFLQGQKR